MKRKKATNDVISGIELRQPRLTDGQAIHALIARCPPLDLNSSYAYFLLCDHHAATCVVAERAGAIVGFLSAYRPPRNPARLFVWQVAVDTAARGAGVAGRMLDELLARPGCAGVRFVETTVAPGNHASRRLFERLAASRDAPLRESAYLTAEHFGAEAHEDEPLLRIGPLNPPA